MTTLARVVEREELERAEGPRGYVALAVIDAWLAEGAAIEVVLPARLSCARCEGGGCDGCGRSGAIRLTGDDAARTFQLGLPRSNAGRVLIRVVRPLGEGAGLEQLALELRAETSASPSCRRVALGSVRGVSTGAWLVMIAIGIAFALAVAAVIR